MFFRFFASQTKLKQKSLPCNSVDRVKWIVYHKKTFAEMPSLNSEKKNKVKKYRKDFKSIEINRYFFITLVRSSFCEVFFVAEKKVVVSPFLPAVLRGLGTSYVLVLKLLNFSTNTVANIFVPQRLLLKTKIEGVINNERCSHLCKVFQRKTKRPIY